VLEYKFQGNLMPIKRMSQPAHHALRWLMAAAFAFTLAACGNGGNTPSTPAASAPVGNGPPTGLPNDGANALSVNPPPAVAAGSEPSVADASRFLTQATFGIQSEAQIEQLRSKGYERWMWEQFNTTAASHYEYLKWQRPRTVDKDNPNGKFTEEMPYEAVWQQWLHGPDQLRARTAYALSQIIVVSNVAPDIYPQALSSWADLLNKNAFANYRLLLEEATMHPAMAYYLNMLQSQKENKEEGIRPNENYAREILQLFSIGVDELNLDGSQRLDANGFPIPTYDQSVVEGFAKAFTGWSFSTNDSKKDDTFHDEDDDKEDTWIKPLKSWPSFHSPGDKKLLNSVVLPAGQTPEKDMKDALDNIFNHPNVGSFVGRQLIQRLVTSNPSPAYIARVATVFNNNGSGVRGDLKAVVRAVLIDPEARDLSKLAESGWGKQREPVIRFANYLRAFNAKSKSGINSIHYLDDSDNALGQSPFLAPTVFNFYSPNYKAPGKIAQAGLYSPEFQITTETSVIGALNFFANLVYSQGYGNDDHKVVMDYTPLLNVASDADALAEKLNRLMYMGQMSAETRATLVKALNAKDKNDKEGRVKTALILTAVAPDFLIQK
jgi:uncharacterized protein (DUF1800 family)/predicted small lipoprotein YifL